MSRIIVITGAGAGLGKHLAHRFASGGDRVVLLGRTFAKIEAAAAEIGDAAMAVACDVASPDSVRAAFAAIAERFPKIDVLINNAAVFEPAPLADASDAHIANTISINLTGAIFCARAAIAMMERGGHILNVSSESVELPFAHLILYQSSKAGLEQFSRSLHRELEPAGIRVTNVRAGQMFEEGKAWDVDPQALQRFGQANFEAGLDLSKRPSSSFESAADVFRTLVNLPPDLHLVGVQVHARSSR